MHEHKWIVGVLLAVWAGVRAAAAGDLPTPPEVWQDYDPDEGDFAEQIVREQTQNGIYERDTYISAYVLGEEIRVYCKYAVKAGATNAPGLLDVHGWMSQPGIDMRYVNDGWAVMAHDYCGQTGSRPHYTKYPASLNYCNMDTAVSGGAINAKLKDGTSITDPTQTSDYVWYAIQRRVLSYLLAQNGVDPTRIGAKGYSYGGTLMWNLGMDPRVKAVVAYFGIGWNVYYRDHAVWMYNVPYVEPPKTPGESLYLSAIAPQAHVPYVTAATLWLNGSNDHHGGHERSDLTFKMFSPGLPWSFAVQARGRHDTDQLGDDCKLWLDKHVLDRTVFWPEQPQSSVRLDADGVPELVVVPDATGSVTAVSMYYALKDPFNFTRIWLDTPCVEKDGMWTGKMPVTNVNEYVFGYANVAYDTQIVLSTHFNAAIPAKLGHAKAKATAARSDAIAADGTR